jgi:hypothetical protein
LILNACGCVRSERTALEALKYNGWELEAALEAYFNHCALASPSSLLVAFSEQRPVPPVVCQALSPLFSRNARVRGISAAGAFGGPKVDTAKIEAFFDAYKDESGELVGVDGVIKLCEDLGVGEEDVVMLVIAWLLKAAKMAEFTKEEWVSGFSRLGIESLDALKGQLADLRGKVDDPAAFKDIYTFAFGAKDERLLLHTIFWVKKTIICQDRLGTSVKKSSGNKKKACVSGSRVLQGGGAEVDQPGDGDLRVGSTAEGQVRAGIDAKNGLFNAIYI